MARRGARLVICAAGALAACTAPPPPPEDVPGRALYRQHCAACHGAQGGGDGDMAMLVPGRMPDLRTLTARSGGTYPRTHVVQAITRISELHDGIVAMPDFGGLLSASPAIHTAPDGTRIETDAAVLELVDYLETLQDTAG